MEPQAFDINGRDFEQAFLEEVLTTGQELLADDTCSGRTVVLDEHQSARWSIDAKWDANALVFRRRDGLLLTFTRNGYPRSVFLGSARIRILSLTRLAQILASLRADSPMVSPASPTARTKTAGLGIS